MNRWVLDASAAIRLYVPDGPLDDQVTTAVDAAARGDALVLAPELLPLEFAQVLLKKERAALLTPREVSEIQALFDALPVTLVSHRELTAPAASLARVHGLSIYDALYLALARSRGATLLTADDRLTSAWAS